MKKRSKIIALVTTLCLCLSMFTIGVLAATSASLSVTSTLNFEAKGVYVMVDASLKQGADVATAAVLSGEGAPTQPTFKAYSYPRESGQDYPNGDPSTTHFVNESGTQVNTWAIGDINYTSTNKVVVYEFLVYNYSNFEVIGTVEEVSDVLDAYVTSGQLTITTYTGTTSADATATDTPTYSFTIPARTNETTPGVTCYKIAVTLNDFMNPLATGEIEMNVSFEKAPEPVYDYFTYSENTITGFSDKYLDLETKPETLVIPNTNGEGTNITSIGYSSYSSPKPKFEGLASSSVIIQEGITSIGYYAFKDCTTLTSVTLPSTLTSIGDSAFRNCSSLTSIAIPEGITSIENYTFYDCSSLTSVSLPSTLTSIGSSAFSGCSGLTGELVIPEGVTSIGGSAFMGCSGLTGELVIPEGVTSIYDYAFFDCSSLTSIAIPEGVTSIGDHAFSGCSGLTNVSLPSKLTSIGISAFSGCSGLTSVSLPSKLTSIGSSAFSGCTNLQYNEYENGKYLGNSENKYVVLMDTVNTTFTEFTIYTNCKFIYDSAFRSCRSLKSITIPEGVTSIGPYAFEVCTGLTSVVLPGSLTNIGSSAFNYCTSLKYIQITGNLTSPYTLPSGTWVKTDSAEKPSDWTNTVPEIPTTNSAGYYHQKSAWDKAS